MKNNGINKDKIKLAKDINDTLKAEEKLSSEKLGLSPDKLKKLENVLSDKQAIEKIMNSDVAKSLLDKVSKE